MRLLNKYVSVAVWPGAVLLAVLSLGGCGGGVGDAEGRVRVDGSSTVYPISEAVAEEFLGRESGVRVTVGVSGTGGGFNKFLAAEIDINDASRAISASEVRQATTAGIEFIELPIAYDGLSVVVGRDNDFVDYLTVDELRRIWQPESSVRYWSDVRPGWPDEPVRLYGPGPDSGSFDYFTRVINGEAGACRTDFTASEDDNILVRGIAGDLYALGYFGYAYYRENRHVLRLVAVDGGEGPVLPSVQTIGDGTYAPLSRPVFIYVNAAAAARPAVGRFVEFYMKNVAQLVDEIGYVRLPDGIYRHGLERFHAGMTGTAYGAHASLPVLFATTADVP